MERRTCVSANCLEYSCAGEVEWDVDITLADNLTVNKAKTLPAGTYIVQALLVNHNRYGYAKSAGILEEVRRERYVYDCALIVAAPLRRAKRKLAKSSVKRAD